MGGKSAQAPDYSQLAAVSREAVGVARDLGQQQIDFSREQYEYLQPLMTEVAEGQIAAQQQQLEHKSSQRVAYVTGGADKLGSGCRDLAEHLGIWRKRGQNTSDPC